MNLSKKSSVALQLAAVADRLGQLCPGGAHNIYCGGAQIYNILAIYMCWYWYLSRHTYWCSWAVGEVLPWHTYWYSWEVNVKKNVEHTYWCSQAVWEAFVKNKCEFPKCICDLLLCTSFSPFIPVLSYRNETHVGTWGRCCVVSDGLRTMAPGNLKPIELS